MTSSGLISISWRFARDAATCESADAAAQPPRGRAAAVPRPLEQRRGAQRPDEPLGFVGRDRGERDRDVGEDLGVEAAHPDEQHRAEARVPTSTDDQLDSLLDRGHAFHGEPFRGHRRHPGERRLQLLRPADADGDAADVRLVRGPHRLEHDRVAERVGRRERLGGRAGGLCLGKVDAGAREHLRAGQ